MIGSISSHTAQFIGVNRVLIGVAAMAVINQIALYSLRSRTLESINKIPMSVIGLRNRESIQQGIDASKTRNKEVISLIAKQNQYTTLSIIISLATTVFCFHKNFKHMKYATLLQAVWNIATLVNNGTLLASLKKHCLSSKVATLKKEILKNHNNPDSAFQIILKGPEIELIKKTIKEHTTVIPSDEEEDAFAHIENSTNATHLNVRELKPEPKVEISYSIEETLVTKGYLR